MTAMRPSNATANLTCLYVFGRLGKNTIPHPVSEFLFSQYLFQHNFYEIMLYLFPLLMRFCLQQSELMKELWFRKQFHIMLEWTDDQLVDYFISGNKIIKNEVRNNAMHGVSFLNCAWNSRCTVITDLDTPKWSTQKAFYCCSAIL